MLSKFFEPGRRVDALRDNPAGGLLEGFAKSYLRRAIPRVPLADICERRNTSFIGPVGVAYHYRS